MGRQIAAGNDWCSKFDADSTQTFTIAANAFGRKHRNPCSRKRACAQDVRNAITETPCSHNYKLRARQK